MLADRFVRSRRSFNPEEENYRLFHDGIMESKTKYLRETDIINQDLAHWKRDIYRLAVEKALLENPDGTNFSIQSRCETDILDLENLSSFEKDWPVRPRNVPFIGSPICILDLPNSTDDVYRNTIHWSKANLITAALNNVVYLWQVDTSKVQHVIEVSCEVTALKWNWAGTNLLLACNVSPYSRENRLQIWDLSTKRVVYRCQLEVMCTEQCYVYSLDWHPQDNLIAAGCCCGSLIMLSDHLEVRNIKKNTHKCKPIVRVKFSPGGKFLATSGLDCVVKIWLSTPLKLALKINSVDHPFSGICWHPWQMSYLIAGKQDGRLCMIDVNAKNIKFSKKIGNGVVLRDCSFNKVTAELVVSSVIAQGGNNAPIQSQVTILSSSRTVVDRCLGHTQGVLHLEWSPDHNILATVGSDETLQLWNFLPRKNQQSGNMNTASSKSNLKLVNSIR